MPNLMTPRWSVLVGGKEWLDVLGLAPQEGPRFPWLLEVSYALGFGECGGSYFCLWAGPRHDDVRCARRRARQRWKHSALGRQDGLQDRVRQEVLGGFRAWLVKAEELLKPLRRGCR